MNRVDLFAAILGLTGLVLGITENEIFTYSGVYAAIERDAIPLECQVIRYIVTLSTALLVLLLMWRTWIRFSLNTFVNINVMQEEFRFMKSEEFKWGLLEMLVVIVHTPPSVTGSIKVFSYLPQSDVGTNGSSQMPINTVLTILMLFRVYLLFRLFAYLMTLQQPLKGDVRGSTSAQEEIEKILRKHNVSYNIFQLKIFYAQNPFLSLVFLFVLVAAIFGYAIRAFERPLYPDYPEQVRKGDTYQDYFYFWNGIWLTFIAMGTVGFGDLYPKTHIGRTLCAVAIIAGITLTSMLTISMNSSLQFTESESIAHLMIRRIECRNQFKKLAAKRFRAAFKMHKLAKVQFVGQDEGEENVIKRKEEARELEILLRLQKEQREMLRRDSDAINIRILLLKERDSKKQTCKLILSSIAKVASMLF